MILIIVESPTKAKTLNKFLGSEFQVEATTGHIKDLPKSKLGIDIENNFEPSFIEVEKRKDTISKLTKLAKLSKHVYIATDPDREGEAIAQHVYEIINNKNSKRISFHEITETAVKEAIKNPSEINIDLVNAQIGRRVLDRLVGYKLSPLLWKKVRVGLSAGRVQTVVVRLIVEREREIEAFKIEEYWEIYCDFKNFTAKLVKKEIENEKQAKEIEANLKQSDFIISDIKKRDVKKYPYPPFTTSTMTQAAARLFGWSSKRTMQTAQSLYEQGLITYHRTDSMNLSTQAVSMARKFIEKEYGNKYLPDKPTVYKTKSKSAQEAHEAIRPTNLSSDCDDKLYKLIAKRFLACQMTPALYGQTTIIVEAKYEIPARSAGGRNTKYELRASGIIVKFDGWKKIMGKEPEEVILPELEIHQKLDLKNINLKQLFTEPPARYNEASLIKTLESLGIGRPSTYAPTISVVQLRNYVEKKEGKFFPTSIGIAVNDFLLKNFPDVFDYSFTAHMEKDLDEIAQGKAMWSDVIREFYTPVSKDLAKAEKESERVKIATEKVGRKCPDCETGELVIRTGRFGKFISCDKFPECKHTEKLIQKIDMKCPTCTIGEVVIKKTKKKRIFYGCSRYPECDFASWKKPVTIKT